VDQRLEDLVGHQAVVGVRLLGRIEVPLKPRLTDGQAPAGPWLLAVGPAWAERRRRDTERSDPGAKRTEDLAARELSSWIPHGRALLGQGWLSGGEPRRAEPRVLEPAVGALHRVGQLYAGALDPVKDQWRA
jgi:hypothetical protein